MSTLAPGTERHAMSRPGSSAVSSASQLARRPPGPATTHRVRPPLGCCHGEEIPREQAGKGFEVPPGVVDLLRRPLHRDRALDVEASPAGERRHVRTALRVVRRPRPGPDPQRADAEERHKECGGSDRARSGEPRGLELRRRGRKAPLSVVWDVRGGVGGQVRRHRQDSLPEVPGSRPTRDRAGGPRRECRWGPRARARSDRSGPARAVRGDPLEQRHRFRRFCSAKRLIWRSRCARRSLCRVRVF